MNSPFVSVEKQQLSRVLGYLGTDADLAAKGEDMPAVLRQLGVCHALTKYYAEKKICDMLIKEIRVFDPQLLAAIDQKNARDKIFSDSIQVLNNLSVQEEMMLLDHLISFAEEFRRVAKVVTHKKKPKGSTQTN